MSSTPLTLVGDAPARWRRAPLGVFAMRVAGAGLAYLSQVLIARVIGAAEYGVFASAWVWVTVLGHLAPGGTGQAACRFIPEHLARGEPALARGFIGGAGSFVALSAVGITFLASSLLVAGRPLEPWQAALHVGLLVVPFFALQDFAEGVARALGWPLLALAPVYLLRPGLIILGVGGAAMLGAPRSAALPLLAAFAAIAIALAVQAVLIARKLPEAIPPGPPAHRPGMWARASWPMALGDATTLGLSFIDVIVLSLVAPPEVVATYFAATRLLQFVAFVPFAASATTARRLADLRARGEEAALRALVRRTALVSAAGTFAVGACVAALGPVLLGLFGSGFASGGEVLAILVAGAVVQSAFGPGEDVLAMLGEERLGALLSILALALAGLLCLLLVPTWGATGAASAMACAAVARGALLAAACRIRLGLIVDILPWRTA